ncbi:glycosyl hydrolase family 18 [Colletotrichum graminicola M1.001]|uniref:chitinase n=1 Tax=Colletotrichum graminicola (strain M1.001 / M2 / FGSC 10212) TaxID=645133 RepID=E3Q9J9_COLGM|nr:glycosyl hydrolase family 18 [Colletotrichum graminicola M1.001]EFQ27378.1 glycosyl hydrolase family 18 [Colletotrichum graminicola M1.001]
MSFLKLSLAALLAAGASAAPVDEPYPPSGTAGGMVASSYFAGFHADEGFPVSSIPWEKYTDVKYAFAETNPDGTLNLSKAAPDQIPGFVAAAHAHNVKALISLGGWTGSRFFSSAIATPENRTAFVKTALDLVAQYDLDGLDFDWEYPNRQGLGCNVINANDTANFALFLQELRQQQPKQLYLTAATSLFPWNDATGAASTNGALAPFAQSLDYLMVMGYDIYGAWASTGGPNAPLAFACDPRNNQGGIEEGVNKWIAAGIPAEKIALGVAAYGHSFSVNSTNAFTAPGVLNAYPPQNSSNRLQGGSWDNDPPVDECGNPQPHSGTYTFSSMITEAMFLDTSGNPSAGIASGYDNCSQTPFLYDEARQIWVSYDDVKSLGVKGQYIQSNKMAGFTMYETGGDYNNILLDAIRSGVGL